MVVPPIPSKIIPLVHAVYSRIIESGQADNLDNIGSLKELESVLIKSQPWKKPKSVKHQNANTDHLGLGFEVFAEYLINCKMFQSTLGIVNATHISRTGYDDHGVDFVVECVYADGSCGVVQVKFKSNWSVVIERNRDHIANCYEQAREDFGVPKNRIVILTNAIGLHKNLDGYRGIVREDIEECVNNHSDFWTGFVDFFKKNILPKRSKVYQAFAPYEHQTNCLDIMRDLEPGRYQYEVPCGAGKTLIIAWDAFSRMQAVIKAGMGSITFLVGPRLALLEQHQNSIYGQSVNLTFDINELGFCSQKKFTKDTCEDDYTLKNVETTCDPDDLIAACTAALQDKSHLQVYITYHSLSTAINALIKAGIKGTAIYFDEAHNLVPGFGNDADHNSKNLKILEGDLPFDWAHFFTATRKIQLHGIYGMDREDLYGKQLVSIHPKTLIDKGIITGLELIGVMAPLQDRVELDLDSDAGKESCDLAFITRSLEVHHKSRGEKGWKAIAFCKGADSKRFSKIQEELEDKFGDIGLETFSMNASTASSERKIILEKFAKAKYAVLLNYDIVSEGIDISSVTAVLIGRNMNSIKALQAACRSCRLTDTDRANLKNGIINVSSPEGWDKYRGSVYVEVLGGSAESESNWNQVASLIDDIDGYITTTHSFSVVDEVSGSTRKKKKKPRPGEDEDDIFSTLFIEQEIMNRLEVWRHRRSSIAFAKKIENISDPMELLDYL